MINIRCMAFTNCGPDRADVLEIERQSFRRPWNCHKFDAVLLSPHVGGVVAEQKPESNIKLFMPSLVVGYLIYKLYDESIHIISMGTLLDSRRLGVGTALVNYVKAEAHDRKSGSIITRIGDRNLDAQIFFKNCGFKVFKKLPSCTSDKDMGVGDFESYRLKYAAT